MASEDGERLCQRLRLQIEDMKNDTNIEKAQAKLTAFGPAE